MFTEILWEYPVSSNANNDDNINYSWKYKLLCTDQIHDYCYEE